VRRLGWAFLFSAIVHGAMLVGVPGREAFSPAVSRGITAQLVAKNDEPDREFPVPVVNPAVGRFDEAAQAERRSAPDPTRQATHPALAAVPRERAVRAVASRATGRHRVGEAVAVTRAALPIPRDPTWYPVKQLDELPRPVQPIQPKLPPDVDEGSGKGRIVLELLIDESGIVTEASVVEVDPDGFLREAALAAVREARFRPASKGGRIVKCRTLLELSYGPRGDGGAL
jgi:TonB family protein